MIDMDDKLEPAPDSPSEDDDYQIPESRPSILIEQGSPFDTEENFIYVVQPFTCSFNRILYPFEKNNHEPILFINDEVLVIA